MLLLMCNYVLDFYCYIAHDDVNWQNVSILVVWCYECSGGSAAKKRKQSAGSVQPPTPAILPKVKSEGIACWFN